MRTIVAYIDLFRRRGQGQRVGNFGIRVPYRRADGDESREFLDRLQLIEAYYRER